MHNSRKKILQRTKKQLTHFYIDISFAPLISFLGNFVLFLYEKTFLSYYIPVFFAKLTETNMRNNGCSDLQLMFSRIRSEQSPPCPYRSGPQGSPGTGLLLAL